MKPAFRASSMCRKTLTAEIQSGTSNLSTSDPSPLPYSLSEPRPAYRTQCFCPMEQSNMAKGAALPPFDCRRVSLKKTGAHRHDPGGGRDAPARCDRQTGHLRRHAARPVRGSDGDVGWKAWRCATSRAPAGRRRQCRRCTATWTCVTRAAIETVAGRGSCSASTWRERNCRDFRGCALSFSPMFPAIRNRRCRRSRGGMEGSPIVTQDGEQPGREHDVAVLAAPAWWTRMT